MFGEIDGKGLVMARVPFLDTGPSSMPRSLLGPQGVAATSEGLPKVTGRELEDPFRGPRDPAACHCVLILAPAAPFLIQLPAHAPGKVAEKGLGAGPLLPGWGTSRAGPFGNEPAECLSSSLAFSVTLPFK